MGSLRQRRDPACVQRDDEPGSSWEDWAGAPAMTAEVQARDREGPGQWPGPGEAQMGEGDMGPVG